MNFEEHISFATDPCCDLGEVTQFAGPLSHCEMDNTHLSRLAENPIRWENLCKAQLVGTQMVLSVIASGCQNPAWDS